jgi:hypothetical protein
MRINRIKFVASVVSIAVLIPTIIFAQIHNPLGNDSGIDIPGFIAKILGYIVRIGGIVAIFAFIWSGFLFVKAQGNPDGLAEARRVFIGTCIGVAVLLGAQLIASIIVNTINSIK